MLTYNKMCEKNFCFTDDVWPMISAQVDWIVDVHPPPASSSLLRAVPLWKIVNNISQLYHHKKVTYLGYRRERCIYIIDKNGVSSEFVALPDGKQFWHMTIMNDKLFVLTRCDWVLVYSLRGEQITSWQINSSCHDIVTAGDKLVADCDPDLIVFDEEGNKLSTLSNDLWQDDCIFPLDSKSIIVVNVYRHNVKRMCIRKGEEMWRNEDDISRPASAVYDGHGNVLVLHFGGYIHVLDVSTG